MKQRVTLFGCFHLIGENVLSFTGKKEGKIKKNKIILIDEVDGIMGSDRGGVPELIRLIEKTKFPIILTANDPWSSKLSPLRRKVDMVELKPLGRQTIVEVMNDILKKENLFVNDNVMESLFKLVVGKMI